MLDPFIHCTSQSDKMIKIELFICNIDLCLNLHVVNLSSVQNFLTNLQVTVGGTSDSHIRDSQPAAIQKESGGYKT